MRRLTAALALLLSPMMAMAAPAKIPVKLKAGDIAPEFVRIDLQGHGFDLKAQRGKIVLIDFWASWCPPCMEGIPHLSALQKQQGAHGFQIVGISMDETAAITKETMQKNTFAYPVVMGDAKFGNLYGGVLGLPLQMLVGRDGRIIAVYSGEIPVATVDKGIMAALAKG